MSYGLAFDPAQSKRFLDLIAFGGALPPLLRADDMLVLAGTCLLAAGVANPVFSTHNDVAGRDADFLDAIRNARDLALLWHQNAYPYRGEVCVAVVDEGPTRVMKVTELGD